MLIPIYVFFLLFSWAKCSEAALERDFQTWINLTAIGKFPSKNATWAPVRYWLEGQERLGDNSSRSSQVMARPALGYALTSNTSVWLGYAWVYTGEPFTNNPIEENRVWQQLLWVKTNRHLTFTSRTRIEQRFLENADRVAYRIRQFVKIAVPFKRYPEFSFVSSEELFWHKNDFIGRNGEGFDQNRVFIGLGYKFNSTLSTELGYLNQYIRRFGIPDFLTNILSINLNLNL